MKKNTLLTIVGAGLVGAATVLGTAYYGSNYSYKEPTQNTGMQGFEQVPGKVLDTIGESFTESLKEFGKDYKANPEKYNNCLENKK